MRFIAKISMPAESGNRAIKDGAMEGILQNIAERWNPEAMYFTSLDGRRAMLIVFDLSDPADMPLFAEPLYMQLDADVQFLPTMDREELQSGFSKLA